MVTWTCLSVTLCIHYLACLICKSTDTGLSRHSYTFSTRLIMFVYCVCDFLHAWMHQSLWLLTLLGLRFQVWLQAWMSVSCECCVSSGRGLSLIQRSLPNVVYQIQCDHEASIMGKPWPTRGYCTMGKKLFIQYCITGLATFSAIYIYIYIHTYTHWFIIRNYQTVGIIGPSTSPVSPFIKWCTVVIVSRLKHTRRCYKFTECCVDLL